MKNKTLSYLLSEQELEALFSVDSSDETLLEILLENNLLLQVDWRGEEYDNQVGSFLQKRAALIKPAAAVDLSNAYKEAQDSAASSGDFIPALLKAAGKELKRAGLEIVLLDRGNDSYYIALTAKENIKPLKNAGGNFWKFAPFGNQMGEILYTVFCSCGTMNVWQLKRGEPLTDDKCEDCGAVIFDEQGRCSFKVIREYV